MKCILYCTSIFKNLIFILLLTIGLLSSQVIIAQPANDLCAGAIVVTVDIQTCTSGNTTGTNVGATDSGEGPVCGLAFPYQGGDVWYEFTMPAGETSLLLDFNSGIQGGFLFVELYDLALGGCGNLGTAVYCSNQVYPSTTRFFPGLTGGNTYLLRFYEGGNDNFGTFDFCLRTPPPPPVNDLCTGAIPATFINPEGTGCANPTVLPFKTDGTTDSGQDASCNIPGIGLPGLDQFFTWTATTSGLYWDSSSGFPGIVIWDATCTTEIDCRAHNRDGFLSGWAIGDNLVIQIYDTEVSSLNDVAFCLEEATPPPPPVNNLCTGAIPATFINSEGTGCNAPTVLPFATDNTTDSGQDGSCDGSGTGLDQFFTWTATTSSLLWDSQSPGNPGIVIWDATCTTEIDCQSRGSDGLLSGWAIGDSLVIQIYDYVGAWFSDVPFCLEEFTPPAPESVPFITTWEVDANDVITIPLQNETYNFAYKWTLLSNPAVEITGIHINAYGDFSTNFVEAGTYQLKIRGAFPHLKGYPVDKLLDVTQWGDIPWASMESMFENWQGVDFTAIDNPDLSNVDNMSLMFNKASAFNQDISNWDVSHVFNMNLLFNEAASFNQPIGNWDVSNVTNMRSMFNKASAFNQDISNWDVSHVLAMNFVFNLATSFNQPIGNWDVSNVTEMQGMFQSASSFNQDLSDWDVSNVTTMRKMFSNASSFNQSLGEWEFNTSLRNNQGNSTLAMLNNTNFDCESWSASIIGWNINNPTLDSMFISTNADYEQSAAQALAELNGRGWTTSGNLVESCIPIVVELVPFITTWEVAANDVITIPLQNETYNFDYKWTLLSNPAVEITGIHTNADGDFSTNFVEAGTYQLEITGAFPHLKGYPVAKLLDVTQWGNIQWASMQSMFQNWQGVDFTAVDNPDLSNVNSFTGLFQGATFFNGDLSNWDVSNVTNMASMFSKASAFNQDLSNWDVGNVIIMNLAFNEATSFNQPIGNWNVSNVINMDRMFHRAFSFNQDIGDWDVSNVVGMQRMFHHASSFNQDLSDWDVSNVSTMRQMFTRASSFNQSLGDWQFNTSLRQNQSNRTLAMLSNTNFDCESWTATIIGWNINNPTLDNMFISTNADYEQSAAQALAELNGRGWTTSGNLVESCIPIVVELVPFITTWEVAANDVITIPLQNETYNFDYKWTLLSNSAVEITGAHSNADGGFLYQLCGSRYVSIRNHRSIPTP